MGNSPHLGLSVLVLLEVGNALASQLFAAALGAGGNFPMPRGDDGPNADHQIHQQNQRNDRIGACPQRTGHADHGDAGHKQLSHKQSGEDDATPRVGRAPCPTPKQDNRRYQQYCREAYVENLVDEPFPQIASIQRKLGRGVLGDRHAEDGLPARPDNGSRHYRAQLDHEQGAHLAKRGTPPKKERQHKLKNAAHQKAHPKP